MCVRNDGGTACDVAVFFCRGLIADRSEGQGGGAGKVKILKN